MAKRQCILAGLLLLCLIADATIPIINSDEDLIDGKFASVSTGIRGTLSKITVNSIEDSTSERASIEYRPNKKADKLKSRLELNTCYINNQSLHHYSPEDRSYVLADQQKYVPSRLQTLCKAANTPLDAVHTYKYTMKIDRKMLTKLNRNTHYILTQWHGSPDPRILTDEYNNVACIVKVSDEDWNSMCQLGYCVNGRVYYPNGNYTGVMYQQGGYPVLTFGVRRRRFQVIARSNARLFKYKNTCPRSTDPHGDPKNPRCNPPLEDNVLWDESIWRFDLNNMEFHWTIQWSSYAVQKWDMYDNYAENSKRDPGLMLTEAHIRLQINGKEMIDWKGPCGRNDEGRVPYFKIGVYNPAGDHDDLDVHVQDYEHTQQKICDMSTFDQQIIRKETPINLTDSVVLTKFNNINVFNRTGFQFHKPPNGGDCVLTTRKTAGIVDDVITLIESIVGPIGALDMEDIRKKRTDPTLMSTT